MKKEHIKQEKKQKGAEKPEIVGKKQGKRDKKGRFVKGVSGNPKGKLPGTVSITTEIKRKLAEVPKGQRMSYLDVLVKGIIAKAVAEGDERMIKLIWNYVDGMPRQTHEVEGEIKTKLELDDKQFKQLIRIRAEGLDREKSGAEETN